MTNTFDCDWNLYFNPDEEAREVKFAGDTWAEWQKRGKDLHSQYADPLFVAPGAGRLHPPARIARFRVGLPAD